VQTQPVGTPVDRDRETVALAMPALWGAGPGVRLGGGRPVADDVDRVTGAPSRAGPGATSTCGCGRRRQRASPLVLADPGTAGTEQAAGRDRQRMVEPLRGVAGRCWGLTPA